MRARRISVQSVFLLTKECALYVAKAHSLQTMCISNVFYLRLNSATINTVIYVAQHGESIVLTWSKSWSHFETLRL